MTGEGRGGRRGEWGGKGGGGEEEAGGIKVGGVGGSNTVMVHLHLTLPLTCLLTSTMAVGSCRNQHRNKIGENKIKTRPEKYSEQKVFKPDRFKG